MKKVIYTNGKLLLSGEYFVLAGAQALAIPTRYGQSFHFEGDPDHSYFQWLSYDQDQKTWFRGRFDRKTLAFYQVSNRDTAERLLQIFQGIKTLNPTFDGFENLKNVNSHLGFSQEWGLGSSSTLIAALAQWSDVDPYALLKATFGGSGYDLACATARGPLLYQINEHKPSVTPVDYAPPFADQLYFIHLGKKQNTREGILRFREQVAPSSNDIAEVNALTQAWLTASSLTDLEKIIAMHEKFIAGHLKLTSVKALHFNDYWGAIKSLGAWGGDFVLASSQASKADTVKYFTQKGFDTIIPFSEMKL